MRNPASCICENKEANQLRNNCAADQRLCFRYADSTIPLLNTKFQTFRHLLWLYSPVCLGPGVGNPEDRFSHNEAHMTIRLALPYQLGESIFNSRGIWWYFFISIILFNRKPEL